jgi:hypothetical protein
MMWTVGNVRNALLGPFEADARGKSTFKTDNSFQMRTDETLSPISFSHPLH